LKCYTGSYTGASRRSTIVLVLGVPWLLAASAVEAKVVLVPNAREIVNGTCRILVQISKVIEGMLERLSARSRT
jgi:hypothetical protein